jgi:hypothetical protein
MNTASASRMAWEGSVVKKSRPCSTLSFTNSSRPGSKIGISPFCSRAILPASLSTQVTVWPKSAKHAPDTRPT